MSQFAFGHHRLCVSNKLPDDVDAAVWWNMLSYPLLSGFKFNLFIGLRQVLLCGIESNFFRFVDHVENDFYSRRSQSNSRILPTVNPFLSLG